MTFRLAAGVFLFACLCSCTAGVPNPGSISPPPSISIQATPLPTIPPNTPTLASTESFSPTLTPTITPTPAVLDRPLYRIRANLDTTVVSGASEDTMTLTVHEEAVYSNRVNEPIQELILQFEPSWRYDLFKLQGVSCDRSSQDNPPVVHDGQLHIPLRPDLLPGESVSLNLDYQRKVANENTLIGWNDYQIVLGDWYAFFPLYEAGKGWLAHPPGKVGEYLTFPYADFDIQLEVAGDTPYQLAASGIPDSDASPWHFQFTGRSFAVALTKQTLFRRATGPAEVLAFANPGNEAQGNSMATTAAQALALYSDRFGEYPHKRLTVLESELSDGMEFDGLVFLSPGLFPYYTGDAKDYLTAITTHETAHQWWYGRVGNDQAMDPWLDEAFAAYSELLFYEKYYPSLTDWWWFIRVSKYPSTECVDRPIYDFSTFRSYVDAVYLRGATMLHALRLRMGDPAFQGSLRELQAAGNGSFIGPKDVFRIFASHSPHPLSGLWNQYLCHPPSDGA